MPSSPPRTLRTALAGGPLSPDAAVRVAVQLCDALIHDHARGAAAHDVRPETILLVGDGARLAGMTVGATTDEYAAPERRRGWSAGDARSDVYAVGVVLYEMLVGRPPSGRYAWPGQVDPVARWLDPIVVRCLSDDPAARYPSAVELRADLLMPAGLPPTPAPLQLPVFGRIVAGMVAGAVLAILAFRLLSAPAARPATAVVVQPASPPTTPSPVVPPVGNPAVPDSRTQSGLPRTNAWTGGTADRSGLSTTPLAGGRGGSPFLKIGGGNRPVLGISYALGTWGGSGCLRQVDPIFDLSAGDAYVSGQRGGTVLARDGYAVAGLLVEADDTNAIAMAVVFMGYQNGRLVPGDRYTSEWVGYPGGARTPITLGGDGRAVVGLCGRQGMNLDAVGLVMAAR